MNRVCLLICALLLTSPAMATDEDFVYESHAGVTIGRVFLSQQQRAQLDAQRLAGPVSTGVSNSSSVDGVATKPRRAAAGYIKSSKGGSRVWKDGDFIESEDTNATRLSFPGEVEVVHHESVDEPAGDAD